MRAKPFGLFFVPKTSPEPTSSSSSPLEKTESYDADKHGQVTRQEVGKELVKSLDNISDDEIMRMNAAWPKLGGGSDYKLGGSRTLKRRKSLVSFKDLGPQEVDIQANQEEIMENSMTLRTQYWSEIGRAWFGKPPGRIKTIIVLTVVFLFCLLLLFFSTSGSLFMLLGSLIPWGG